jgi:iron complex transport system substrate-binding protein
VEGGSFPWRGDGLADATGMSATDTLPYEQIAALRPDVIVVSYFVEDQEDYDRLAAIAPTVATLTDRQVDTWQDITGAAGTMLGAPDEAEALVAEVEQGVADLADELPGLSGKSFVLANFVAGDAFHLVSDPEDGANVVFDDLGMTLSPTVLEAGEGVAGRVELSLEQASLLDADLLVLFTNGADPEEIVGYDDLPAVRSGAAAVLDYATVAGLNTPSPLSLPYALDAIRPALDAAAEA